MGMCIRRMRFGEEVAKAFGRATVMVNYGSLRSGRERQLLEERKMSWDAVVRERTTALRGPIMRLL
jgi:hypothetical protein